MGDFIQRLQDPTGCATPRLLNELDTKLARTMTRLFRQPKEGGNPFLYFFAMSRPHFLCKEMNGEPFPTAATDGKHYYWNPDFLESLDADQTATLMCHEALHDVFFHTSRMSDKEPRIANVAMDFVVNAVIQKDHEDAGRSNVLWGGPLGAPLNFADYLSFIDGAKELSESHCFVDTSVINRSPESIYDEIMMHWEKSPRKCKKCKALSLDPKTGRSKIPKPWGPDCCQECGAKPNERSGGRSMDSHIKGKASKQEILADMMAAAQQARSARGTVPAGVDAALKELEEPTLQVHQIIRHAMFRKAMDCGSQNDYSRFRRRYLSMDTPMYLPKKKSHMPRWLAMIDTSGSMSDLDIMNGIKELKLVANNAEGWIVPCDSKVYWDKKTRIENVNDLKQTKIAGRGGTEFTEFVRDYPREMPGPYDVIMILTDGDCGIIDPKYRPPCDLLWVVTNMRDFKPTFGRVVQLAPAHH